MMRARLSGTSTTRAIAKALRWKWAAAAACGLVGCATPSAELVEARRNFNIAKAGVANTYVPDRVLEAQQALSQAERAHEEDDGSFEERNFAYIASRKALIAIAEGNRAKAERDIGAIKEEYVETQSDLLKQARVELQTVRAQLTDADRQLESERQARREAEKELGAAMASLREVANVKADSRGIVITLEGAVLFPSGQAKLLPIAKQKLVRVAKALRAQGRDKLIVIEGHTDSRGPSRRNLNLSRKRAEAVREHLIKLGVSARLVRAVGRGEGVPIANNGSAEGRANNRRVEIVVNDS